MASFESAADWKWYVDVIYANGLTIRIQSPTEDKAKQMISLMKQAAREGLPVFSDELTWVDPANAIAMHVGQEGKKGLIGFPSKDD